MTGVLHRLKAAWERIDVRYAISFAFLLIQALLLFWNLGHYALWDDEANTGLFAKAVWSTGDTSAVIGDNIVAYRNGLELAGLKNRLLPPLPYYFAAPFLGLLGDTAWAVRLPFALAGWLTSVLAFFWLKKDSAKSSTFLLLGLASTANVSLILYSRQGRYYGLSTLLTVVLFYLYVHRDNRRRTLVLTIVSALALLATQYIAYASLALAIGVDYLLFGHRRRRYRWSELLAFLGSQLLLGGLLLWIWNPPHRAVTPYVAASWLDDRLRLFWWNLRDLNACEFGALLLVPIAPLLFWVKRKETWLFRIPLAILVYDATICVLSPQPVGWATVADIRYMQAAIPGFIYLSVLVLECVPPQLGFALAIPFLFTNTVQAYTAKLWSQTIPVRSTFLSFIEELSNPQSSPYSAAANWLNQNVPPKSTVWVLPDFATYPLMFHASKAIYAWQLEPSMRSQYPSLPAIHFRGLELPQYIVAFGGSVGQARSVVGSANSRHVRYVQRAYLGVHWPDLTRPELFWRSFSPVAVADPNNDGIFVFQME